MNDPELYRDSNVMAKRDTVLCLEEFGAIIKWKTCHERVIDIGCGDGGVTVNILKKYIPPNYRKIVGCDISEEMVKFANENHSSDNTEFIVLDIEGELPDTLRSSFDHAVSFYALHWIERQEVAFLNTYELLAEGGGCWLMFFGHIPYFEAYVSLAGTDRWRYWLKNAERYLPPYQYAQDPGMEVKQMMEKIGFTNTEVNIKHLTYVFSCIETFNKIAIAASPFKIPKDMHHTFLEDFLNALDDLGCVDKADNGQISVTFNYSLIIASGDKPC